MADSLLDIRREYLSAWPEGAPVEGWASEAQHLAVRLLAQYVLHLEDEVERLESQVERVKRDRFVKHGD